MALNKEILKKLGQKTREEKDIQEFLVEIFKFEDSPKKGWYKKTYTELLEKYVEE